MIGLEVSFNGSLYKAQQNDDRILSFLCTLHNNEVHIDLGAYNRNRQCIDRWLFTSLQKNDKVVVTLKEIEQDTPCQNIPLPVQEDTPEFLEKRKQQQIRYFRELEAFLYK